MRAIHPMREGARIVAAASILIAVGLGATPSDPMTRGPVQMRSIGALTFGPDGVLFAGDSLGGAVFALDVGSDGEASSPGPVEDLDGKLAALLGTEPRNVFVKDMAVQPGRGVVYLSVMRGAGPEARPVLMRIRAGELEAVPLDDVRHARVGLTNAPSPEAKLYVWESRSYTITDLEFIGGELYVAGLSNEEFASTLRRLAYPFGSEVVTTGLEIYHGAHGEYETFAPIFTFMPLELDGTPHLLASYLCTPLVTFPIGDLAGGERVRGKTLAELGWGNIPIDMLRFEQGGQEYLLMTNTTRGSMKIRLDDIRAAQRGEGITDKSGPRTGVDYETSPLGHVVQVSDLDAESIAVLTRNPENGALALSTRPKRRL